MILLQSLIFLIITPGLAAVRIPLVFLRTGPQIKATVFAYLAVPLWLTGAFILLTSFWNFVLEGHGTPAPVDPPKELVTTVFYRYIRNPMYVGIILILIGHFLWSGFWLLLAYASLVLVFMHLFVICYEEPTLKKRFGAAYDNYLKKVPRWIPRFK